MKRTPSSGTNSTGGMVETPTFSSQTVLQVQPMETHLNCMWKAGEMRAMCRAPCNESLSKGESILCKLQTAAQSMAVEGLSHFPNIPQRDSSKESQPPCAINAHMQ